MKKLTTKYVRSVIKQLKKSSVEPITQINYMQTGDYHCLTCHNTYNPEQVRCKCIGNQTKPCTEKCGKWFTHMNNTQINEEKDWSTTGDHLDRFRDVADGLSLDKLIANKIANFIHFEVIIAKRKSKESERIALIEEIRDKIINLPFISSDHEQAYDTVLDLLSHLESNNPHTR